MLQMKTDKPRTECKLEILQTMISFCE
uniref:Uncharacterized protein n=1 Tax=Arundo donax TaxID=35708 RepID=A0A0A8YZ83_ARUDO